MIWLRALPSWLWLVVAFAIVGVGIEFHGRSVVQQRWDAAEKKRADNEMKAVAAREENNRLLAAAQAATNLRVKDDYEKAIALANGRVADARRGGLRYAGSCVPAGSSKANGTVGSDGAVAGTVQLPDAVANGLFDLAADADKVVEQARACQNFIRENGLGK